MKLSELKNYDGKDGRPAYVGCNGKVYDVSKSDFWTNGLHMGRFHAGTDLSAMISKSPHGPSKMNSVPCVGDLESDDAEQSATMQSSVQPAQQSEKRQPDPCAVRRAKLQKLYAKYHPHPINVHFPMGILPLAFFTQVIALLVDGSDILTSTSIVAMIFGTFFLIPSAATGFLSFYVNYGGRSNVYLKRKIVLTALVCILGVAGSVLGASALLGLPFVQVHGEEVYVIYSAITVAIFPVLIAIGYNGGKITWPDAD